MPNGGTDNCMNCAHNRANHQSANVKSAPRYTRQSFCSVHNIPMWDHAWTYCSNINTPEPDIAVPINTVGLYSEGYSRIPWLGRTAPIRKEKIAHCEICNSGETEGLAINSDALGLHVEFCSNDHYREWHTKQTEALGFEGAYSIGRNTLHEAVLRGDLEQLESLTSDNSSLNKADHFGWTPIHLAAFMGFEAGVNTLIKAGATAKARDAIGELPIDLAGSEGHTGIVNLLQQATYVTTEEKETALLKAAADGNLELVEVLINADTAIECTDYRGRTPLLLAVWGGHYTTSVFLLDHGANVHVEDEYGNSPVKTVDTWNSRNPSELHRLIHEWIKKSDTQDPS